MPVSPVEIRTRSFFWMLKPWKDGKLATIDGWARFCAITFEKNDRMSVKPLIRFPRRQLEGWYFQTWPQANLLWAKSEEMMHIADVVLKKSKSFIPFYSGMMIHIPVLIDPEAGIVLFYYSYAYGPWDRLEIRFRRIFYNYKTDTVLSTEEDAVVEILWPMGSGWFICNDYTNYNARTGPFETYFYNLKTGEVRRNKLTRALTGMKFVSWNVLRENGGLSLEKRYIIAPVIEEPAGSITADDDIKYYKISWDENYDDIATLPLDYLAGHLKSQTQAKPFFAKDFYHSEDGVWVTSGVGGYRGLRGELLDKRVFFHMDSRYPGGISMPVVSTEYDPGGIIYGQFVNHPVYGMSYVQEHHSGDDVFLWLYKMSDVLREINSQLMGMKDKLKGNS